jgi:hypothetical protein
MVGGIDETQEPTPTVAGFEDEASPQPKGKRRSFGQVRRELTEAELSSPGVQKLLLDELDRMDGSEIELRAVSEKYYMTNTSLAIAQEKLKTHNAFDIISTGTVAFGSILFGAAFSFMSNGTAFWLMVVLGGLLIVTGIAAKVVRA